MDAKKIDSYLFNEMDEADREKFENEFVADDEVFAEVTERENELVDRYVRNEITGDELTRFERSLESIPARRHKIANARMLREFIAGERPVAKTITIAERKGFFSELFSFRSPALQFASIGAIMILAVFSILLLRENRRLGSLEGELAASRQRVEELSAQTENAQDATGELTEDLVAERQRVQQLESEIAKLRDAGGRDANTVKPTIATVLLPLGVRSGSPPVVQRVDVPNGVERISAVLVLPTETAKGSLVTVKLNGETLAKNIPVRVKGNEKRISVTIPTTRANETRNEIVVIDTNGDPLGDTYFFSISRSK